jgi:asparagine synthase (glutamine-hydrolysing)
MSAKLGPKDPAAVAATLSAAIRQVLPEDLAATFCGTVVVDANDLGCNVLGTDAPTSVARLERMFADNPLGQGTQQTPIALVLDDPRSVSDRRAGEVRRDGMPAKPPSPTRRPRVGHATKGSA